MTKYYLVFIFFISISVFANAQFPDLEYQNKVYSNQIKTVQMHLDGSEISEPVLNLSDNNLKLLLSFDDFDGGFKNYNYALVHCNADWLPSTLQTNEFVQGFNDDLISKYSYSISTFVKYTHYELSFPNANCKPIKSGNYIIYVYRDFNPQDIILSRRFMVYDNKMNINANIHRPAAVEFRNSKQEIDFTINYQNLVINDVFNDIKVCIQQNGRWDNALFEIKPTFVQDNQLTYDTDINQLFNGGNEFRTLDLKTLQLKTSLVNKIEYKDSMYNVYLMDDERRAYTRYTTWDDINGKYVIRNQNGFTSNTDADYINVYFSLKCDKPYKNSNVYVDGLLNNWECKQDNRMIYNEDKKIYECKLMLKQGLYNYQYTMLYDGAKYSDQSELEGNLFETENEYLILVYVRPMGSRYDQLLGFGRINSVR